MASYIIETQIFNVLYAFQSHKFGISVSKEQIDDLQNTIFNRFELFRNEALVDVTEQGLKLRLQKLITSEQLVQQKYIQETFSDWQVGEDMEERCLFQHPI